MMIRINEKNQNEIIEMELDAVDTEKDVESDVVKEVVLSDLDLMLQSVGEELKTTVVREPAVNGEIKNKNTEITNRIIDTPGGLWTKGVGRRKRCRHTLSASCDKDKDRINSDTCDENCESDVKYENQLDSNNEVNENRNKIENENENDKDRNEVLKKMKNGLLDPSRSLPAIALTISKNILTHLTAAENGEIASNELKLKRLLQMILFADNSRLNEKKEKEKSFESVKLNSDYTKIIFRSSGNNGSEAFCYIVWGKKNGNSDDNNSQNHGNGDNNGNGKETEIGNAGESHSAVIQCDNDGFKSTVILALQSIL